MSDRSLARSETDPLPNRTEPTKASSRRTGQAPAKCYALVGIHRLNPNRFKQLTQPLTESSETVTIMLGCMVSQASLNQILKQIAAGKY